MSHTTLKDKLIRLEMSDLEKFRKDLHADAWNMYYQASWAATELPTPEPVLTVAQVLARDGAKYGDEYTNGIDTWWVSFDRKALHGKDVDGSNRGGFYENQCDVIYIPNLRRVPVKVKKYPALIQMGGRVIVSFDTFSTLAAAKQKHDTYYGTTVLRLLTEIPELIEEVEV